MESSFRYFIVVGIMLISHAAISQSATCWKIEKVEYDSTSQEYLPYSQTSSPIRTVKRIYLDYLSSKNHDVSQEIKTEMSTSLYALRTSAKTSDLPLLINVWLNYDVTDFFAQKQVEAILFTRRAASVRAINYRILHKKKWESPSTSPFKDLYDLKRRLAEE